MTVRSAIVEVNANEIRRQLEILVSVDLGSKEAIDATVSAVQLVMTVARPHLIHRYPIPDKADGKAERIARREKMADILLFIERSMMAGAAGDGERAFTAPQSSTPPALIAGALGVDLRLLNSGIQSGDLEREKASNSGDSEVQLMAKSAAVKAADWIKRKAGKQVAYEADLEECGTTRTAIERFRKSASATPFPDTLPDFTFHDLESAKAHLKKIIAKVKSSDSRR